MNRQIGSLSSNRHQQRTNQSFPQKTYDQHVTGEDFYDMISDVSKSMANYCAKRPKAAALALLSVGFFLGWKIKPW